MSAHVLDSWALLAFFNREKAGEKVRDLFAEARESQPVTCHISLINMGEVYYIVHRRRGDEAANVVWDLMGELPMKSVQSNAELTKSAAMIKARHPIAYADCFAIALSKELNAKLWTGDPEIKSIDADVELEWLGNLGSVLGGRHRAVAVGELF